MTEQSSGVFQVGSVWVVIDGDPDNTITIKAVSGGWIFYEWTTAHTYERTAEDFLSIFRPLSKLEKAIK